jgi:hypothetical protein
LDSWQIKAYESSVWRSFLHDGEYHIEVHSATISNYYARREFADASIQVEARYIGDDGNLYFGIVSRHSRLGAYYFFVDPISHFYAFDRFGDGGWKRLQNGYLPESDARKPNSVYRLRVDMNDGNLRLYVNDHYLTQVDDYELVRGQVGLVVSASLNSRIHVAFDNLVIRSGQ